MKVRLTKLSSSHTNLRTGIIEGTVSSLPEVGEEFIMHSAPLEVEEGVRYIRTTPIIEKYYSSKLPLVIVFRTQNSKYQLEVLSNKEETK